MLASRSTTVGGVVVSSRCIGVRSARRQADFPFPLSLPMLLPSPTAATQAKKAAK